MKKIYSIVLMAAALLVGTNVSAANVAKIGTTEYGTLAGAFAVAKTGQTITLIDDVDDDTFGTTGEAGIDIFMANASDVVTLDLNGKTIYLEEKARTFNFYRGHLIVTGTGTIFNEYGGLSACPSNHPYSKSVPGSANAKGWATSAETYKDGAGKTQYYTDEKGNRIYRASGGHVFWMGGSATPISKGGTYTWLEIGENVTLISHHVAVYTDLNENQKVGTQGSTIAGSSKYNDKGVAFGVRADIYGDVSGIRYGIQVSGNLNYGKDQSEAELIKNYAMPVYNVYGKVHSRYDLYYAGAVYGGGYGDFNMDGAEVYGSTAVFVKSGAVTINDSKVYSDSELPYKQGGGGNGIDCAAGSAIVLNSNKTYPGEMTITVSGESEITGATGYSVESYVTNTGSVNEVSGLQITGGTFESGAQGCFEVTPVLADAATGDAEIIVSGGSYDNVDIQDVLDMATGNHVVGQTTDADGNKQYVITPMPADGTKDDSNKNINGVSDKKLYVIWNNYAQPALTSDVRVAYLEMNGTSTMTIPAGKKVIVGAVVMSANSSITVEPGAELIITDANGFVANKASNLVIKTSEDAPAYFLIAPAATDKLHPMATIEFASKSYRKSTSDLAWQRFGIPTYGAPLSVIAKNGSDYVATAFARFDYDNNKWEDIGIVTDNTTSTLDLTKMANAFDYYQMLSNTAKTSGTVVTMTGRLVGNEIPKLNVRGNFWNGYSNSMLGNMDITAVLNMIPNTVDKAIYLYDINATQATWEPCTYLELMIANAVIQPMQPFLIRNTLAAATVDVDYYNAIYKAYDPDKASAAPARHIANNWTMAKLIVKGENSKDRIIVAEGEEFSAEFDNGYDAAKYMNDGINMYVMADEKMSNFATDNLDNTYVGFQTVKGGNYTIEFANVNGDLTLIDLATGDRIAMVEGNVYEFTADANTTNDYRFQIVNSHKAATAVENVSAANNGAVYTIMGQYVGEMSDWDILPAGIYVVDGVKRVK